MCENRQQPTWILRRESAKDGVHACVLRIFFFFTHNCATYLKWSCRQKQVIFKRPFGHFFFLFFFCCYGCARIDNNRREYCHADVRKLVYMCVCSAFFLFWLHNCANWLMFSDFIETRVINHLWAKNTLLMCCVVYYLDCARIDNNRREYWERERRERWCACVCAPHFFLFFVLHNCASWKVLLLIK